MFQLKLNGKAIWDALVREQKGAARKIILIALKRLHENSIGEKKQAILLTLTWVQQKFKQSTERTRLNFVRRVYKKNKLFALDEIRLRYPEYDRSLLELDLRKKPAKPKRKKSKPIVDLRRRQLEKLACKLKETELPEEYNATCIKMVILQNAHNDKLPIPLTVTYNKQALVYYFRWNTREHVVKDFVNLANSAGMNHAQLEKYYSQMTASTYSY